MCINGVSLNVQRLLRRLAEGGDLVMPAKAGIHACLPTPHWTPAFAGVADPGDRHDFGKLCPRLTGTDPNKSWSYPLNKRRQSGQRELCN